VCLNLEIDVFRHLSFFNHTEPWAAIYIHTLIRIRNRIRTYYASQPASQPAACQRSSSGTSFPTPSTRRHLGQMLLNVDNEFMNAVRSFWHTISTSFNKMGRANRMTSWRRDYS